MNHKQFYRDTWVEINLQALYENIVHIRRQLPDQTKIIAAVKANGYGHGAFETAQTAIRAGADGLAVAFLDEALALRQKGIEAPILILGATNPEHAAIAAKNEIALTVFSSDWLHHAEKKLPPSTRLRVHVKCDTGMGRIGITEEDELQRIERILLTSKSFTFEGIFTHFATADQWEPSYYHHQLSQFQHYLQSLETTPPYIHAANSAAALFHRDSIFNAVRVGIAMYGLSPSDEVKANFPFQRQEAFSLRTKIVHVKKIKAGEKVGYGGSYEAKTDEWIATLPIGYADGWIRKLTGQRVIAGNELVPIVGRICMDQTMIKLPFYMPIGTTVTLIGKQGDFFISVDDIAKKIDTINYEVTCNISSRVPRVYINKPM